MNESELIERIKGFDREIINEYVIPKLEHHREPIPDELKKEVIKRDKYKCHQCGNKIARWDVHIDHVIPVCRGGKTSLDNLRMTHSICNLKKSGRYLEKKEDMHELIAFIDSKINIAYFPSGPCKRCGLDLQKVSGKINERMYAQKALKGYIDILLTGYCSRGCQIQGLESDILFWLLERYSKLEKVAAKLWPD
jgi:hypothetical protein